MTEPKTSQPASSDLTQKELYLQLEEKVKEEKARGEKARIMRTAIVELSNEIGQKRLAFKALLPVVRKRLGVKIARQHFMNVCERNWTVETDENDLIWIDLNFPKATKIKQ